MWTVLIFLTHKTDSKARQNLQPQEVKNVLLMCLMLCVYNNQCSLLIAAGDIFFSFSIDPTLPNTFWTIMVGLAFMWCGAVCINQSINQRYLACKSVKDARM